MTDILDGTGLYLDDALTRLAALQAELRVNVSSVLDLSADQPWGQLTQIINEHHQQLAELLQEIYSGLDPDEATGQTLDGVCSITGTYRRAATYGTVSLDLTFSAAGTVPAGSLVSVAGDPDNQWGLDADVVALGAGTETGAATATETGPLPAAIGTITTIVTPVANWTAVTNPAAASEGLAVETDTALRLRREQELATGGSTTVDAIQAAVSPITGVLEAICLENDTWRTVAPIPPKAVEVIYWTTYTGAALTALNVLLAEAIFEEKAGGVQAYGTTEVTHTDEQGNDHQVGMTLAAAQALQLRYTLTTDGDYPGDADFSDQVAEELTALFGIGDDVLYAKMIDVGFNVPGVVNITLLSMNLAGAGWVAVDIAVAQREIATVVAGDVTVI